MSKRKEKQYLPVTIEYKAAIITLTCIIVAFGVIQIVFSKPIMDVVASKQYDKLATLIVQAIIYLDAVLASLLAILLQLIYSIKSIKKSENKKLGIVTLLTAFLGIAGLVIPPLLLVLKL